MLDSAKPVESADAKTSEKKDESSSPSKATKNAKSNESKVLNPAVKELLSTAPVDTDKSAEEAQKMATDLANSIADQIHEADIANQGIQAPATP